VLDRVAALDTDALGKLRALIEEHIKHITADVQRCVIFFRDFQCLTGERRATIIAQRDRFEIFTLDLITSAQREGTIISALDARLATKALLGSLNWTYTWYRPEGEWDAKFLSDRFQKILFDGMIPRA
jgi:hypothetical protein